MKINRQDVYWYDLPQEYIAQEPAVPRDESKLLIYNTKTNEIKTDYFYAIGTYLPPSTAFTLNDSKVVPARVTLHKESGGKIVVLFLINEWLPHQTGPIPCFFDRKAQIGDKLFFNDKSYVTVKDQQAELFHVTWDKSASGLLLRLAQYGTMPIPPYIKHSPLTRDDLLIKYQTIFAKNEGSSAAPTASLHYTERVFESLRDKHMEELRVTLHVGLGTFAPLTEQNIRDKKLHNEWYEISERTAVRLKEIKKNHIPLLAVGTTVVRTLESYAHQGALGQPYSGDTDLFIMPGYKFQMVDMLQTNFHLPSSSLMMLVDAFLAHKKAPKRILELYEYAKKNKFRFFSFGDTMLIV
ncbi:MAG: tRNA preQ1(34) S-adenosylmethionine ribosyltransferase-isomerase QueA [Microgenomates group bacterium]